MTALKKVTQEPVKLAVERAAQRISAAKQPKKGVPGHCFQMNF